MKNKLNTMTRLRYQPLIIHNFNIFPDKISLAFWSIPERAKRNDFVTLGSWK